MWAPGSIYTLSPETLPFIHHLVYHFPLLKDNVGSLSLAEQTSKAHAMSLIACASHIYLASCLAYEKYSMFTLLMDCARGLPVYKSVVEKGLETSEIPLPLGLMTI